MIVPNKPYKLSKDELENIKFPVYCQPKMDGWRLIILKGQALTYKLKPIPNNYIRTQLETIFKDIDYYLIDGEGLLMDESATYQDIQSAYASVEGEPDFRYVIFDAAIKEPDLDWDYNRRLLTLNLLKDKLGFPPWANAQGRIQLIQYWQYLSSNKQELDVSIEYFIVNKGLEGAIIRSPDASYKQGRSTLNEAGILAYKPFTDAEAEIIGAYCLEKNLNDLEKDEHGHAKRSSRIANKVPLPMLGGFNVRGVNGRFKGVEFNIGSGFTLEQREAIWDTQNKFKGCVIKYKYFDVGSMDKPRQPIFLGFRSKEDL